ncbi:major facilitator superfamily domain-containing protein [Xylariaceae sp. FL1272]|nr:major facilitator superfamily domain-containing protein [Xylariaceae sp. FL1272]
MEKPTAADETLTTFIKVENQDGRTTQIDQNQEGHLSGWRLHTLTIGLCVGTFLVNLEVSIVSTSLVAITNDLKHFSQATWVVTAYLLTYTSFMIITAKLSDMLGRKSVMLFSLGVFTVFSGACAAAGTIVELIVLRALQGIGGCGIYALSIVVVVEMAPSSKWPLYMIIFTSLFAIAMILGPIFGGLINEYSRWVWVFLLNVPGGAVAFVLVAISMPARFPHQNNPDAKQHISLGRIDFLGGFLLLAAMTLWITSFEQAANLYPWSSATVLAPLVIAIILWGLFFVSQWWVTTKEGEVEPVFPWRFCTDRVVMGIIANSFLSGTISTTCIINIPLRFQTAAGLSALQAGIRLIPLTVTLQIGAMLVAILTKKGRTAPIYLLLVGAGLQLIGVVFLSQGDAKHATWSGIYGFEAVTGVGLGLTIGVVTLMMPHACEVRDRATATSAIIQFRFLGGATVLAIVTAVANKWILDVLATLVSPEQAMVILRDSAAIGDLPDATQMAVRESFVQSFDLQMKILIGFAAAQFPVTLLMWKRNPLLLD